MLNTSGNAKYKRVLPKYTRRSSNIFAPVKEGWGNERLDNLRVLGEGE